MNEEIEENEENEKAFNVPCYECHEVDDIFLPENIRKYKQDIKDLSILESLKLIERNEKLDLTEITFDVNDKQKFKKITEKSFFRIQMSYENTLKDLIELLEGTFDIYQIKQWRIVDLDIMTMANFGDCPSNLSFANIKDLELKELETNENDKPKILRNLRSK